MKGSLRQFGGYFWGTLVRPRATFDQLATEPTVRWGVLLAALQVLQVWSHMALHAVFGLDYLGPRALLPDPVFIAFFGYWQIGLDEWLFFFFLFRPLLALLSLVVVAGVVQLLSKLWGGQGTFEQGINVMAFALLVPALVVGAGTEWIFSVPMDLISGHGYWWTATMQGEFGPIPALVWSAYVVGVYFIVQYGWMIALGTIAIQRFQKIPRWAAAAIMVLAFAINFFVESMLVR